MTFTVGFGPQWSREWKQYQPDQKIKVGEFVQLYQAHGLDPTKLPGRISPSWMGLQPQHPNYAYTQNNFLWHYHIGLPQYTKSAVGDHTSDWVLHFQWVGRGSHIDLLELSTHQVMGKFYLPPAGSLPAATPAPSAAPTPAAQKGRD
jgi:hypothetical protein